MYGPLEYMVIEFPGDRFADTLVPTLQQIVAKDIIRIVDLLFIKKDADGTVTTLEFEDLLAKELPALRDLDGEVADLFSEEDVALEGEHLAKNAVAVMVLFEHTWTIGIRDAIKQAHGSIFVDERVPPDLAVAAQAATNDMALG